MQDCFLKTGIKKDCTGCTACMSVCPKKAISMYEDEEGFRYPIIDKTKCIGCKLCEKVCPIEKVLPKTMPKAFSYVTNNKEKLLGATSGGAFGDIVDAFFVDNKTYIYGCTYGENNKVIHKGVNNIREAEQFKKSKYVQSNLLNVFNEVKQLLEENNRVLFSGTPCQISGLKSFLLKDYDNLLLVDIVCHGTPSQKLFDYYIMCEEKKYNLKINKIVFREKVKERNGKYSLKNIKLVFENNDSIVKNVNSSSFFYGFQARLFYRPSCYFCKFASVKRNSDITLCDIWGLDDNDNMGMSGIIINSKKGESLVNRITGLKKEIPVNYIVKINECYTRPTHLNKNRNKFFKDLNCNNFEFKSFKYGKKSLINKFIELFKRAISKFKRIIIKK